MQMSACGGLCRTSLKYLTEMLMVTLMLKCGLKRNLNEWKSYFTCCCFCPNSTLFYCIIHLLFHKCVWSHETFLYWHFPSHRRSHLACLQRCLVRTVRSAQSSCTSCYSTQPWGNATMQPSPGTAPLCSGGSPVLCPLCCASLWRQLCSGTLTRPYWQLALHRYGSC